MRLSLAIALALGSPAAMALGLGGISVKSELNQPLAAEIPVYVSSPQETESLAVRLASPEEFSRVGLNIGEISTPILFEVAKNARGEPVIRVSSADAIREPFVTFLVEVNWANGRLLREYSVLLEPPITSPAATIQAPAPAPAIPSAAPAATPVPEAPVAEPEPIAAEPVTEPVPEPAPVEPPVSTEPVAEVPSEPVPVETPAEAPAETPVEPIAETPVEPAPEAPAETAPAAAAASEYGPVATGETLWEIASTTRPNEAVTVNQMMLALLRANPDAFYRDNVNALKRGAVLRIPGSEELLSNGAAEAAAEILSQNQTWIQQTQASVVADADAGSSTRSSSGTRDGGSTGSRVQLVPPSSGDRSSQDRPGVAGGTGEAQALRQDLARAKEELASKTRESEELSSRVKELEGMNQKSERMIAIANSQIAALEKKLKEAQDARAAAEKANREAPVAAVDPTPAPVAAEPPVETTPEPVAAEPVAATDPATSPDAPAGDETTAEPVVSEPVADATEEPTPVPLPDESSAPSTDAAAAPQIEEPPFYMNPIVWGGALGALLLGALAFFGLRRKKSSGASPAAGSSSLARSPLSDAFAGGVAGGAAGAAGGDPEESRMLAELARDPTDLNAHLSLLEHYYTSRNIDKFEAQAEAMYAQVPSTDSQEWQGAVLMGKDLCPTHPLFADDYDAAAAPAPAGISDPFGLPDFQAREPAAPPAPEPARDQFGFELAPSKPVQAPPPVHPSTAEEFDFNLIDQKTPEAAAPKQDLDIDLGFDFEKAEVAAKGLEAPSIELPQFTLETEKTAPPASTIEMPKISDEFLGDDAVATKLDLARAYLDMGDSDGAKSMLDEVLTEGNDRQKEEARKLLAEIR